MNLERPKTTLLDVPSRPRVSMPRKVVRTIAGGILCPWYWLLAHGRRAPGLEFHLRSARLALHLLVARRVPFPNRQLYYFMFFPMDSTRYFEFDFMWHALESRPIGRYLDVSSPRLFPTLLLGQHPRMRAELINPDRNDLELTARLLRAAGLTERVGLHGCAISAAPFNEATFDVITSISVLEHIPDDRAALEKMWALLRPGGHLLLSVPCAVETSEQHINHYEYGVLTPDEHGYTFWQRFYDRALLESTIFPVTGRPVAHRIYGEKRPGFLQTNLKSKYLVDRYPFWREAYMMSREFAYFEDISDLPGEGVIAMEFVKG